MSHRCGGRRTQFHARTLAEPWTQRHTTSHSHTHRGTNWEAVLLKATTTHPDTLRDRHTQDTHTHTPFIDMDTSMHRDKSRDTSYRHIPPWVTPVINPEPVPYPHACSDTHTHTHTESHTGFPKHVVTTLTSKYRHSNSLSLPPAPPHTHTHTQTHMSPHPFSMAGRHLGQL